MEDYCCQLIILRTDRGGSILHQATEYKDYLTDLLKADNSVTTGNQGQKDRECKDTAGIQTLITEALRESQIYMAS